jgi:hypothetical protein
MPKSRAHELREGDILDVAGKTLEVYSVSPGYCDHSKIAIQLFDPKDPAIMSHLLVPRHYKLKLGK